MTNVSFDKATHAIVIDVESGKIICSGPILLKKNSPFPVLSFDKIRFFHADGTEAYRTILLTGSLDVDTEPSDIPESYTVLKWKDVDGGSESRSYDIYLEQTSLDEGIEKLVYALSQVSGVITTGSCSGHIGQPLFVTAVFKNIEGLSLVARVLNGFRLYFQFGIIPAGPETSNTVPDEVTLTIMSVKAGHTKYNKANELANAIYDKAIEEGLFQPLYLDKYGFPC